MNTYILSVPSNKISWAALGVLACMLSLLYIVQINRLVELTYQTLEYEEGVKILSKETATLEMRSGETFSIPQLELLAQTLQFERVNTVRYITIGGGVVAKIAQ
ncbi:MAG: hypothetical protein HYV55_00605 [Parcubacteria group bacterium]|nr:hypothetical protein [Parcubacteria group bacterium]